MNPLRKRCPPSTPPPRPQAGMGPGEVPQGSPGEEARHRGASRGDSARSGGYPRSSARQPGPGGSGEGRQRWRKGSGKIPRQLPGSAGGPGPAAPRQQQPQPARPPGRRVGRMLFSRRSPSPERGIFPAARRGEGWGPAGCCRARPAKGRRARGVNGFAPAPCSGEPAPPTAAARSSPEPGEAAGAGWAALSTTKRAAEPS